MQNDVLEQLRSGRLAGIRRLTLAAGLTEFPREIFELADTLEILDLTGNALTALPDDLPRLRNLRILFCSNNQFTELPAVLGQCLSLSMVGFKSNRIVHVPDDALPPNLRWLILTDNRVECLPAAIGRCGKLQKLMLAGNRLQALPPELVNCTRLELLRISANRLQALPEWLLSLPRLAWLAYGGNPFCESREKGALEDTTHAVIPWHQLQVGEKLGEGASGFIHRAYWNEGAAACAVAVKLFKGAVTSDGLPHSEMAACIAGGGHPNLIPVHGKVAGHHAGQDGLVMALVDPRFRTLAGPPSLDSCTRDVYAAKTQFAPEMALRLALSIASAIGHLHRRGLMHGDLYAHNTLYGDTGEALLGDCGAASFLPIEEPRLAAALQRLEARAFACLLEELLERCAWGTATHAIEQALRHLQAQCAQENAALRPLFAEIVEVLRAQLNQLAGVPDMPSFACQPSGGA
ncbi:MAG TPA: leucine-rich repeat-containing protein kinase family protein [Gallionellaceae bacterium]